MATICDLCGKGKLFTKMGRHHRGVAGGKWKHKAQKTRRVLKPNLHPFNGVLNGKKGKWWLCTKCLRKVKGKKSSNSQKTSSQETHQQEKDQKVA